MQFKHLLKSRASQFMQFESLHSETHRPVEGFKENGDLQERHLFLSVVSQSMQLLSVQGKDAARVHCPVVGTITKPAWHCNEMVRSVQS